MKVREALLAATRRLSGLSDTPRLDAELLMAQALDVEREDLLLSMREDEAPPAFEAAVDRRVAGEPIAYILGRRAFWTIELDVSPAVLIPRPDTETLMEAAVEHFGARSPAVVLDLGTGSGALLLAALDQWPEARGIGIDRSEAALAIARANAERLGLAARAEFRVGDWAKGIGERFDLVLCNPPYIEEAATLPRDVRDWEPHSALYAGSDGLGDYRRIAPAIPRLLRSDGTACIEIGDGQQQAVSDLFAAEGLRVDARRDLGGHVRCLLVTL